MFNHRERPRRQHFTPCVALVFLIFVYGSAVALLYTLEIELAPVRDHGPRRCSRPALRREWRELAMWERDDYLRAVICLAETKSKLSVAGSIHDDFAWIHMAKGSKAHFSSPFFPWHRLFLHIFETSLKSECGFKGNIPYWDWTLDGEDLATAPVWDSQHGFGGDGDATAPAAFLDGSHCVTDGPFKNVTLRYANSTVQPHCLSRGFYHYETHEEGKISGEHFSPSKMSLLMMQPHYDTFRNMTEYALHNAIHWGLRGDFGQWASANDPIFYLHHTQIDRLWWQWQQQRPERNNEYYGQAHHNDPVVASTKDYLHFGRLWKDVKVSEVMIAEAKNLCYRY